MREPSSSLSTERHATTRVRPRRLAVGAALASLVMLASACGSGSGTGSAAGGSDGSVKDKSVVYVGCDNTNAFCAAWNKTFQTDMQKSGVKVRMLLDKFDPATQAQHMNQAVALHPDAIVVGPASEEAIVPALRRADQAGIPVVHVKGSPSDAGAQYVTLSVETNNKALGQFAAQNIVDGLAKEGKKAGNIIALTGTSTQSIVQQRVSAFKAEIAKHPGLEIVAIEDANWDEAKTAQLASQLFAKYDAKGGIQAAYGMADNQAVGIIQAAQQAGMPVGVKDNGLVVTGSNCSLAGSRPSKTVRYMEQARSHPLQKRRLPPRKRSPFSRVSPTRRLSWFVNTALPRRTSKSSSNSAASSRSRWFCCSG